MTYTRIESKIDTLQNNVDNLKVFQKKLKTYYSKIAGVWETTENDRLPLEPHVVTVITNTGCTLSKFYTDSTKTQLFLGDDDDDDGFTLLHKHGRELSFTREYPEGHSINVDGSTLKYVLAKHTLHIDALDDAKPVMFAQSVYCNNLNTSTLDPDAIEKLSKKMGTGYTMVGHQTHTRLYIRERTSNDITDAPKEFAEAENMVARPWFAPDWL